MNIQSYFVLQLLICMNTHTALHCSLIVFILLHLASRTSFFRKQNFCAFYVVVALANAVHTIHKYMMVNSFITLQIFIAHLLSSVSLRKCLGKLQ